MKWDWQVIPGHETQPLYEFYVEQAVMFATTWVAHNAHKRGDRKTAERMLALAVAAAEHEEGA